MLKLKYLKRFKKDFKKFQHNHVLIDELDSVLTLLLAQKKLSEKYKDHALSIHFRQLVFRERSTYANLKKLFIDQK